MLAFFSTIIIVIVWRCHFFAIISSLVEMFCELFSIDAIKILFIFSIKHYKFDLIVDFIDTNQRNKIDKFIFDQMNLEKLMSKNSWTIFASRTIIHWPFKVRKVYNFSNDFFLIFLNFPGFSLILLKYFEISSFFWEKINESIKTRVNNLHLVCCCAVFLFISQHFPINFYDFFCKHFAILINLESFLNFHFIKSPFFCFFLMKFSDFFRIFCKKMKNFPQFSIFPFTAKKIQINSNKLFGFFFGKFQIYCVIKFIIWMN